MGFIGEEDGKGHLERVKPEEAPVKELPSPDLVPAAEPAAEPVPA